MGSLRPELWELERNPPQLNADMKGALLELVNRFKNESTSPHPQTCIPFEEVGQFTIEQRVSTTRGKWHKVFPGNRGYLEAWRIDSDG